MGEQKDMRKEDVMDRAFESAEMGSHADVGGGWEGREASHQAPPGATPTRRDKGPFASLARMMAHERRTTRSLLGIVQAQVQAQQAVAQAQAAQIDTLLHVLAASRGDLMEAVRTLKEHQAPAPADPLAFTRGILDLAGAIHQVAADHAHTRTPADRPVSPQAHLSTHCAAGTWSGAAPVLPPPTLPMSPIASAHTGATTREEQVGLPQPPLVADLSHVEQASDRRPPDGGPPSVITGTAVAPATTSALLRVPDADDGVEEETPRAGSAISASTIAVPRACPSNAVSEVPGNGIVAPAEGVSSQTASFEDEAHARCQRDPPNVALAGEVLPSADASPTRLAGEAEESITAISSTEEEAPSSPAEAPRSGSFDASAPVRVGDGEVSPPTPPATASDADAVSVTNMPAIVLPERMPLWPDEEAGVDEDGEPQGSFLSPMGNADVDDPGGDARAVARAHDGLEPLPHTAGRTIATPGTAEPQGQTVRRPVAVVADPPEGTFMNEAAA